MVEGKGKDFPVLYITIWISRSVFIETQSIFCTVLYMKVQGGLKLMILSLCVMIAISRGFHSSRASNNAIDCIIRRTFLDHYFHNASLM